nr:carbohydrate sulfotransferase 4 isoform X2 [Halyomorpha halys]
MPAEYSRLNGWKDPWRRSRIGLLTLAFLSSLCFASFLLSQRFVTTLPTSPYTIGRSIQVSFHLSIPSSSLAYNQSLPSNELTETVNISQDIEDVLTLQKEKIVDDILKSYNFPGGFKNQRPLSDLVPALGGQPLRSVIIATWRSGSTFLGDILNSVPGNFYHYEPLLDHGIVQVRGPPRSKESLRYIRNLLNCNYTDMDKYLSYGQDHTWLFTHNNRLWEKCTEYPHLCWLPIFLNRFCSLFPFQSMKLVRLRLKLAEELLADEKLGVKVVLVVRDPRGTMQSRRHRDWCPGNPDCDDPTLLCADLVADYSAAHNFIKKYPKTFKIVRYEDFSLDPYKGTEDLFKFLGINFGPEVKRFLDTHTKSNAGGVSSTFRNSKSAPFHWRMDLSFSEVQNIQRKCSSAMDLWGYTKASNSSHQKLFNPIKNKFSLKP